MILDRITDEYIQEFQKLYPHKTMPRSCGTCYACCVVLGITELRKYPGQTCKHLSGADATKRCSIYSSRPTACSTYHCGWLAGLSSDNHRPNNVGFIISAYPKRFVIQVFDETKAGNINSNDAPLYYAVAELLELGVSDLVILFKQTKDILHFLDGDIYKGKQRKGDGYEDLTFETYTPPVGKFELKERT